MSLRGPPLQTPSLLRTIHFQQHYGFLTTKKLQCRQSIQSCSVLKISQLGGVCCSIECLFMALISVFQIGSFSLKLFNINGVLYHSKHCLQDNQMSMQEYLIASRRCPCDQGQFFFLWWCSHSLFCHHVCETCMQLN